MVKHKYTDYFVLRGDTYHYRRKIPTKLQDCFEGKAFYSHSLYTGLKSEAKRISHEMTLFFDDVMNQLYRNKMIEHRNLINSPKDVLDSEMFVLLNPTQNLSIKDLLFGDLDNNSNALITFEALIDKFIDYKENVEHIKEKTLKQYQSPLKKILEICSVKYIDELSREVLRDLDNTLRKELSLPTLKQYYTCFKVFLNYIKKEYKDLIIVDNILDNVRELSNTIKVKSVRNSFSIIELQNIFSIDYSTKCTNIQQYLIGVLLLCTGMRPVEIARLHIEDVKIERGNTGKFIYIDVKNRINALGQSSLKTAQSERMIPLSRDLPFYKEFAEYVVDRKNKHTLDYNLFDCKENYIAQFMSRIVRSSGITDKSKTAYSLRHYYTQKLAYSGIHQYFIDYLTGHSSGNITQTVYFGKSHDICTLYEEVCKCDFKKELFFLLPFKVNYNNIDTAIESVIVNTGKSIPNMKDILGDKYQDSLMSEEDIENLSNQDETDKGSDLSIDDLLNELV